MTSVSYAIPICMLNANVHITCDQQPATLRTY